jgi:hypothetical protein
MIKRRRFLNITGKEYQVSAYNDAGKTVIEVTKDGKLVSSTAHVKGSANQVCFNLMKRYEPEFG